ncbi:MAG: TlpA family protein disulfide reductase [Rhodospirillales bacterium CG15_BIG_FIL_POST_REV_8_21_14_020_66_15]|nr:MAG: TlpA family protein disulfide reductase [Rhodospirillales bacterium CG15_BIG_FIL_POST_REV_8_21_14_020_66_15]
MSKHASTLPIDAGRRICALGIGGLLGLCALPVAARGAMAPTLQGRLKPFICFDQARPAPLAGFRDGQGRGVNALSFYGEAVLLNFWATWCAPCVWEMPQLDRLQARYAGRGLRVVAVSEDEGGADVAAAFYRQREIRNLPVYVDPDGAAIKEYGWIHGLPLTFLTDRKTRVIGYMDGPADWDSPAAYRLIDAALSK